MEGRPANQAGKGLIRPGRVRTSAGRGVGWRVEDGLVQTSLEDFVINECASGRPKDLADVEEFEKRKK